MRDFSEGLAASNYKGRWGYIDLNGNKIIDFKFRSAYNFSFGLALVQSFDYSYFFINKKGQKAIEIPFDEAAFSGII